MVQGKTIDRSDNIDDWLKGVQRGEIKEDYCFPSDRLRREYIATIESRSDVEVLGLLRRFLIPSSSLGSDQNTFSYLVHLIKTRQIRRLSQFQRRLVAYCKAIINNPEDATPPWEGITWILDLLPNNPRAAIASLDAYFEAHCMFMPDGRIHGMADATEIIRAKYIERPRSSSDAIRLLLDESPRTFEHLVERLVCVRRRPQASWIIRTASA